MPEDQPTTRVLALLTDAYGGRGGIAEYNRNLLQALNMSIPGVIDVIVRHPPRHSTAIPRKIQQQHPKGGKIGFSIKALFSLLEIRPDLIFCGHINFLPLCVLLGRLSRTPVWLQIHGIDAWQPLSPLQTRLMTSISRVLSVSEFTRQRFLTWSPVSPDRVKVLPNTYDEERFTLGAPSSRLLKRFGLDGKKVLLTVGRLDARERYKGQDLIINIMPNLLERIPNLAFLIAGDGDDKERLEKLAKEKGLSKEVIFAGYVPHEELPDLYRTADLLVLAGFGEGFGIVLLEAMACGTPVIASSRDGSQEAVANGRLGAVVDPDETDALAQAIVEALATQKVNQEEVRRRFGFDAFAQRVANEIREFS